MIHTWANIALIFLIILSMIVWLVPLVLLFFSVKGMRKVRRGMDDLMPRAQQRAQQAAETVHTGSQKVIRPLVWAHARWAGLQAAFRTLKNPSPSPTTRDDNEVQS